MNKISRRNFLKVGLTAGAALAIPWSVFAQTPPPPDKIVPPHLLQRKVKPADRRAAADRLTMSGVKPGLASGPKAMDPGGIPHYYGPFANYANSPMPKGVIGGLIVDNGGSGYTAPVVVIDDVYGTGINATADCYCWGRGSNNRVYHHQHGYWLYGSFRHDYRPHRNWRAGFSLHRRRSDWRYPQIRR